MTAGTNGFICLGKKSLRKLEQKVLAKGLELGSTFSGERSIF
jgi:hypothetical protein